LRLARIYEKGFIVGRFVPPTFSPNDQHPTDDD
jgi:hypothetical protein